ncbi:MAG: hypothetical protein EA394_07590 [Bacteroidia bacterium]|nr:MAG: hypothetical protein EA394_07590 [Bacteroidia bacterium]
MIFFIINIFSLGFKMPVFANERLVCARLRHIRQAQNHLSFTSCRKRMDKVILFLNNPRGKCFKQSTKPEKMKQNPLTIYKLTISVDLFTKKSG